MSRYKVIAAPYLNGMLLEHVRFISRVSVPAAKRFRREFAELTERLAENPYQFPVLEDPNLPRDTYRKALFAKWYRAVFFVEGDCVYIDAVVDCRRDPGAQERL